MKHLHFDVELNGFYGAYWAHSFIQCQIMMNGGEKVSLSGQMLVRQKLYLKGTISPEFLLI